MADGKFTVGQIGAKFIVKVEEDTLTGHLAYNVTQAEVSALKILFKTPDRRTKGPYTAIVRPGTTDEVQFTTTDALLIDIDGEWKYRAEITTTSGDTMKTLFASEQVVN